MHPPIDFVATVYGEWIWQHCMIKGDVAKNVSEAIIILKATVLNFPSNWMYLSQTVIKVCSWDNTCVEGGTKGTILSSDRG